MAGEWGVQGGAAPTTMEQLHRRASDDLETPWPGVLLYWSFLLARAAGDLSEKERRLAHLELRDRDVRERMLGAYPPRDDVVATFAVGHADLDAARASVRDAVTWLRAIEHVLRLLERARVRSKTTPVGPRRGTPAATKGART